MNTKEMNYSIPQLDLSLRPDNIDEKYNYLFEYTAVDEGEGYLGHPDSCLVNGDEIMTFYPEGHGRGRVLAKKSFDGGKSYKDCMENPPESWAKSKETPTVYRLEFTEHDWQDKIILICGNPKWWDEKFSEGGFNCSVSEDEGKTFSEFELFFGGEIYPIVSMSSLTKLKENGKFVDKWMGLFHDKSFVNYKTVLSFDENGKMQWSRPIPYFSKYRDIEKKSQMCEVECVRSDAGLGDELMLITRSNSKRMNSLLSFSTDEGETWSSPVFAPAAINGERHKADYLKDGRLFITFRSIERDKAKNSKYSEKRFRGWYSEGWIGWVGTYDDLKNGREGQYRIKIAHTYLPNQNTPQLTANADTGYCGNVVLSDGTVVTSSYGIFSPEEKETGRYSTDKGRLKRKTFIASKRIKTEDVEELISKGFTTPDEAFKRAKRPFKKIALACIILLLIAVVVNLGLFIYTSYSLKGNAAKKKIETVQAYYVDYDLKAIDDFVNPEDAERVEYYYRYKSSVIFESEACVVKASYGEKEYKDKKAMLEAAKFTESGPLFQVYDKEKSEFYYSTSCNDDDMLVLSETEFDISSWHFVTDKSSRPPKLIMFYGFNDKENTIAYVLFEDSDLDIIDEPMEEFFDYYVGCNFQEK